MHEWIKWYINKSADSTGLPIINSSQFVSLTEKYGKEEFRIILAEYIAKEKPEYPLRKFNEQKNKGGSSLDEFMTDGQKKVTGALNHYNLKKTQTN